MATPGTPPIRYYVFWDADSEYAVDNFEFEKFDRSGHLKFLKLQWGTQKSKCENFDKKWQYV